MSAEILFGQHAINYTVCFLAGVGVGALWGWAIVALMRASRKVSPGAGTLP